MTMIIRMGMIQDSGWLGSPMLIDIFLVIVNGLLEKFGSLMITVISYGTPDFNGQLVALP